MPHKKRHIGIICGFPFPEGMAATTRIITYSKSLIEIGYYVDVFIFSPTDQDNTKDPPRGEINGLNYYYPKSRNWSKYKFVRVFVERIRALIFTFKNIYNIHVDSKFDFILINSDYLLILAFFMPLITRLGIKVVFITDEYPVPIRLYLKNKIPFYKEIAYKLVLRRTSGMIFMTENLRKYFKNLITRPSLILPTIVDFSRFINITENSDNDSKQKYLCYMGNMELSKDNIDNILIAFSLISNKYPDLYLYLYGQPSEKDKEILLSLITDLSLKTRVFFMGRINYNQVPSILYKAHILVSSQPKTKRAEGGFPTKLGEYLSTGKPILLTNVGEISLYIQDKINGFLCEPENPNAYADTLAFIMDNYDFAQKVGQEGKRFVTNKFNNKKIAEELASFFDSL